MLNRITGFFKKTEIAIIDPPKNDKPEVIYSDAFLNHLSSMSSYSNAQWSAFDGDKFFGGFGATQLQWIDYWTLRERSSQLFNENLYARGIVRLLVTNIIHKGLNLQAMPDGDVLGIDDDEIDTISESIEDRWNLYVNDPELCHYQQEMTYGELQELTWQEALVSGDVLQVYRIDRVTKLPNVELIDGARIRTPIDQKIREGNKIVHGVELDKRKRHVAYWVTQENGKSKRVPVWGERSGRRISKLVYGTDKRNGEVRGQPLLSLILQSLKEIDRYRDSTQRKAVLNAMLAIFIKKGANVPGSGGFSNGVTQQVTDVDGSEPRNLNFAKIGPGTIMDELAYGEEPIGFGNKGTDEAFGPFEQAILSSVAWANEIPPEIMLKSFNSNYSASQGSKDEFNMYLDKVRSKFGKNVCKPLYILWLTSEVLNKKLFLTGYLRSTRDRLEYDIRNAWIAADWIGTVKPSADILKTANGYAKMVEENFIDRDTVAQKLSGQRSSRIIKKNARLQRQSIEEGLVVDPTIEEETEPKDDDDDATELRVVK